MKRLILILLCVLSIQEIIAQEITVIDGKVYRLNDIKNIKVTNANRTYEGKLPELLGKDHSISLFNQALEATHLNDSLLAYIDMNYSVGKDSTDWTNDRLCIGSSLEYDNVAYMPIRYFKFTVFAETDEVLADKYGITSLDELKALARQLYDPMYPEDAGISDPTDRRNSLNRFVSYHMLPFQASYYQLTCVDGPGSTLAGLFDRHMTDISDWYETMMPHSLMKFSFPMGEESGLYINRRGVMSHPDARGVKIRGAKVTTPEKMGDNMAINGIYYYIDDILAYDQTTQNSIIGAERLRMDCTTLSPDFLTSGARGHYTTSSIENGKYGRGGQGSMAITNCNTCLGFKGQFTKNFKFNDAQTHLHVRNRVLSFWSYEGDDVTISGYFDVTVKLPPVPEGDWELRLGSTFGVNSRGIVQYYFGTENNMTACGMPQDMRPGGANPIVGWKSDNSLGDAFGISNLDVEFHKNGWMKGPANYGSGASGETGGGMGTAFRDIENTLRKVIVRFHSDGKSDYYLRMKQVLDVMNSNMDFDYIELCPECVYDNEYYNEDIY